MIHPLWLDGRLWRVRVKERRFTTYDAQEHLVRAGVPETIAMKISGHETHSILYPASLKRLT